MAKTKRRHPTLEYRLESVARPAGKMSAAKQQPLSHLWLQMSVQERRLQLMASTESALQVQKDMCMAPTSIHISCIEVIWLPN